MFQFVFDSALFEFAQPGPAFAPLFRLPPTRRDKGERGGRAPHKFFHGTGLRGGLSMPDPPSGRVYVPCGVV